MNADDPAVVRLRAAVRAAQEEFDLAVMFHEVWKPSTFDEEVRKRMGVSYATNAFNVVRVALRRETLMALVRLWDRSRDSVQMTTIAKTLRMKRVLSALAAERASRFGLPESESEMFKDLSEKADATAALIDKYAEGGSHKVVLDNLVTLRNKHLAHRQVEAAVAEANATDKEIEDFYQDTSEIVRSLLSVVLGTAYDPQEAASVYGHYAELFWAGVRGEQTEGHPKYRGALRVK